MRVGQREQREQRIRERRDQLVAMYCRVFFGMALGLGSVVLAFSKVPILGVVLGLYAIWYNVQAIRTCK